MAWTSPRTWVVGEILTAALANLHLRDNLAYLKGDAGWTAPVLTNSWVNNDGGYTVAGYRRVGDFVFVQGLIKNGAVGSAAFTLPAGYRPGADLLFAASSANAFGSLRITSAGGVIPEVGSNVSFSINCVFAVA